MVETEPTNPTNPQNPTNPAENTPPTNPANPANPQNPTNPTNPANPEKTFSQEDVNRIVEERLARDRAKYEKDRKQAEELAKLSAEERAKKEFELQQQEFENEKKQFHKYKLEVQTAKELTTKNLPSGIAPYIVGDDAETTRANLENIEPILKEWLESAVTERLRGRTPNSGAISPPKDAFLEALKKG